MVIMGNAMRKPLLVAFSTALVVCVIVAGAQLFNTVKAATTVSGIIASDTAWTKANSPYNLTGNVLVNNGVTLTIQSGVVVNLNNFYIMVNGTFIARGSGNDRIIFNNGQITFTQFSSGWNQGTHSGSIMEYAVFGEDPNSGGLIGIENASPMISNSAIRFGIVVSGGSPIIFNNNVTPSSYYQTYGGQTYGPLRNSLYGIVLNTFYGTGNNTAIITDNVIIGDFEQACIIMNAGNPTIQRNTISDNVGIGIDMSSIESSSNPIIQNNTISSCRQGILDTGRVKLSLTVIYNNFQNNSKYNIYWGSKEDLNATYNWWGTTDAQAISQKIYDNKNDYNLGTVTFVPFLTEPNPEAMPDPNAPIPAPKPEQTPATSPTPTPDQTPTPTPSQEPQQTEQVEAIIGVAIAVAVIGAGLGLLIYLIKRK